MASFVVFGFQIDQFFLSIIATSSLKLYQYSTKIVPIPSKSCDHATADIGKTSMNLNWRYLDPSISGGSAITGYKVYMFEGSSEIPKEKTNKSFLAIFQILSPEHLPFPFTAMRQTIFRN